MAIDDKGNKAPTFDGGFIFLSGMNKIDYIFNTFIPNLVKVT